MSHPPLRPRRPRPAPTSSRCFLVRHPGSGGEPLGPREPGGAGRPGLHSPLSPGGGGPALAAPRAAPLLPPPGRSRGRRSASGLLPAGCRPDPLHLVPHSGRRSPVSCIDPEAAFPAQQQHVTPSHVSRPLREWEGAPEEQVLPDRAGVAMATGMSVPAWSTLETHLIYSFSCPS